MTLPALGTGAGLVSVSPTNGFLGCIADSVLLTFNRRLNLSPWVINDGGGIVVQPGLPDAGWPSALPYYWELPDDGSASGSTAILLRFPMPSDSQATVIVAALPVWGSPEMTQPITLSFSAPAAPDFNTIPVVNPGAGRPVFYGVNPNGPPSTQTQAQQNQALISEVQSIGARIVRIAWSKGGFATAGQPYSLNNLAPLLQELGDAGISYLFEPYLIPNDGSTDGGATHVFATPSDYADYVENIVTLLLDGTVPPPAAIELGNEPNVPLFWPTPPGFAYPLSADSYFQYLQAASLRVHGALRAANIPLLNGGLGSTDDTFAQQFLQEPGLSSLIDAVNVHLYYVRSIAAPSYPASYGQIPYDEIWKGSLDAFDAFARNVEATLGANEPIWVTEGAFSDNPLCFGDVDQATQASMLIALYNAYALRPNVQSFFWYSTMDGAGPPTSPGCWNTTYGVGLEDSVGNPRIVHDAYRRMTSSLP